MVHPRFWIRRAIVTAALLLTIALSSSAARADKMFLFLEDGGRGIAGDSTERAHAGWIGVESFGWGLSREENQAGGGGGVSRAKFTGLRLVKRVDPASNVLTANAINGRFMPRAILEVCRDTRDGVRCYYRLTLNDVQITGFQPSGNAANGATEELTLSFARIRWEYFRQAPDGRMVPAGSGGYDVRAGKMAMGEGKAVSGGGQWSVVSGRWSVVGGRWGSVL